MSNASGPGSFELLWEMVKGPLLKSDALNSYEIDEKILNQIGPWEELEAFYPVSGGQVVSLNALQFYLEQQVLESQPEIDLDALEELVSERIRQIEQGAPLTEGEEESQSEHLESSSFIRIHSFEHDAKKLFWASEMEPSGMGYYCACSYGPFRSFEDACSVVNIFGEDWPDVETF
jgi:hypothetical protein